MNRTTISLGLALAASGLGVWGTGCGDDEIFDAPSDGTVDGGPLPDGATEPDGGELSVPTCGDAGGAPPRLLVTLNQGAASELVAFNLSTKAVDGKLSFASGLGAAAVRGSDPYLIEQGVDVVARLDAREPWKIASSWNVAGDVVDGGPKANPIAVVVPACDKGYVLRYKRNDIAVIDTNIVADGGAPESFIDLAPLVQADDKDGLVDMTSAVYVRATNRIYVLLANFDLTKVATDGFTALCSASKPTVIAIDASTGQLVSLGGTGPGGGIALSGANPPIGASLFYDQAQDRLLVLTGGCNTDVDGGAGAIARRGVEEVKLTTGAVRTLLDLNAQGFPGGMLFVDGTRAAIGIFDDSFVGHTYFWDPSRPSLGADIPGGFDYFVYGGKNALVGARRIAAADGGAPTIEVRSTPFSDAGVVDIASVTSLGTNPFTSNTGFLGGADIWPKP